MAEVKPVLKGGKPVLKNGLPLYEARVHVGTNGMTTTNQREKRSTDLEWLEGWARKTEYEAKNGTLEDSRKSTLGPFLIEDYLSYKKGRIADGTWLDYKRHLERHVIPRFGTRYMSSITPRELQKWLDNDVPAGYMPKHLKKILHNAYAYAMTVRIVKENPLEHVTPRPHEPRQIKTWNLEEATKFLHVAQSQLYEPLWTLCLLLGLRPSEAKGLQWADVDFKAGVVHIRRGRPWSQGKQHISKGKTKASLGAIPMPPFVQDALARARTAAQDRARLAHQPWDEHAWVVTTRAGKTPPDPNITRSMERLSKQAAIDPISPYGMRHTCATLLLANGVPFPTIQAILRHKSAATTLRYIHPDDIARLAGLETLANAVSNLGH